MRIVSEEQAELADPGEIHWVSVAIIHPNPDNVNIYNTQTLEDPDFQLLCNTMRDSGQNQEPITITPDLEIISGHRRWSAARQIGMPMLRCVIDRAAKTPEIRRLKLIIHNMHRRKTKVEVAREIIYWRDAIEAFQNGNVWNNKIHSKEMVERLKTITEEERAFLKGIIDQNSISIDEEDALNGLDKLKGGQCNSATKIALRFMGQSKNMPVAKLKAILETTDMLRSNGAGETAAMIEELINKDEVEKAYEAAKNYNPSIHTNKKVYKPVPIPKDPEASKKQFNRVLIGCRTPFSQVRHILGTHKLWLTCASSHKSMEQIFELLNTIENNEEQLSRRRSHAEIRKPVAYKSGEDSHTEVTVPQPTPVKSNEEIDAILKSLT